MENYGGIVINCGGIVIRRHCWQSHCCEPAARAVPAASGQQYRQCLPDKLVVGARSASRILAGIMALQTEMRAMLCCKQQAKEARAADPCN